MSLILSPEEDELDIDFDEIGEDLERFQEDETVQQALHKGVDLKKYGQDLEKELKEVQRLYYYHSSFFLILGLFFLI